MKIITTLFWISLACCSCSVSKNYNPSKKFSPAELEADYEIFRNALEESHPSLYWFTPKDSMDFYFEQAKEKLKDSLVEYKFRYVLNSVLSRVRCGHTTVRGSKASAKYAERSRSILFPLNIKAWDDTVVITSNVNRKDSNMVRGSLLKSIDGKPVRTVIDSLFHHLSADGYNTTHKFQTLSNANVFRTMYASIYGVSSKTPIEYIDTNGVFHKSEISLGALKLDSSVKVLPVNRPSKRERKKMYLKAMRSFRIDTSMQTAFLEVNSFAAGNHLRSFLRKSFRAIHQQEIPNLVVDMRGNGGGNVTLSNLLTKYMADKPFCIADSLYAITNKSRYGKYQSGYFFSRFFFFFFAKRMDDGHYHFRYFEKKYFRPRQHNHFNGNGYILTGGNTFSAASLFTRSLKSQQNIVVVGEETGGGAYGNTAWRIPEVTLPNTRVRFRLPLFRLVTGSDEPFGHGISPEVEVKPTVESIRRGADFKMEKVKQLIREKNRS